MFTPEQKIQHLKNLGFEGDLSEILKMYLQQPFNVHDKNYQKLLKYSYKLCKEYSELSAFLKNENKEISEYARKRKNEIIDILFPGHESIYGLGDGIKMVIGMVDNDGFNMINVRAKFNPTVLVHLKEYVFIAPNCVFGEEDFNLVNGQAQVDPITVNDNTWICANVTLKNKSIVAGKSIIGLGSTINEHSCIEESSLAVGNPCKTKIIIDENYKSKKVITKSQRSLEEIRFLIQHVRNIGIDGDLDQYIRMLNGEEHNCLEPTINLIYNLSHELCAVFNHKSTPLIRKQIILNELFPMKGKGVRIGSDLYVDILGATKIGDNVEIGDCATIAGNIAIGNDVKIGKNVVLQAIGHRPYYKDRHLKFHEKGYPIEINTIDFIEIKDNLKLSDGTKVLPNVVLTRNTLEDELVLK